MKGALMEQQPKKAALLSLIPGLGQIYNKQKAKGFIFLAVTVVFVLYFIVLAAPELSNLITLGEKPGRDNSLFKSDGTTKLAPEGISAVEKQDAEGQVQIATEVQLSHAEKFTAKGTYILPMRAIYYDEKGKGIRRRTESKKDNQYFFRRTIIVGISFFCQKKSYSMEHSYRYSLR